MLSGGPNIHIALTSIGTFALYVLHAEVTDTQLLRRARLYYRIRNVRLQPPLQMPFRSGATCTYHPATAAAVVLAHEHSKSSLTDHALRGLRVWDPARARAGGCSALEQSRIDC